MPAGRPTDYTQEKADAICHMLSDGMSLRSVCRQDGMPEAKTVFNWMRRFPEFLQQYARAKDESADALVEQMMDIADDEPPRLESGAIDNAAVQHQRLRVDVRKWAASKLKPKKYGDKLHAEVEHTGNVGGVMLVPYPMNLSEWQKMVSGRAVEDETNNIESPK
jgi:transposase-like protein